MATTSQTGQYDGKLSSVTDEVAQLRDNAKRSLHDAADGGMRVAQSAVAATKQAATDAQASALKTRDRLGDAIAERPFTSVAIALGAGALLMGLGMMWRRR